MTATNNDAVNFARLDALWDAATNRGTGSDGTGRARMMLHIMTDGGRLMPHIVDSLLRSAARLLYPWEDTPETRAYRLACEAIILDQPVPASVMAVMERQAWPRWYGDLSWMADALLPAARARAKGDRIAAADALLKPLGAIRHRAMLYAAIETIVDDWRGGWDGVSRGRALQVARLADSGQYDEADAVRQDNRADWPKEDA